MGFLGMDRETKNTVLLAAVALIEALQLLVLTAAALSYCPLSAGDLAGQMLAMDIKDLKPEREMFLFRLFVVAAIGIQTALLYIFRRKVGEQDLWRTLRAWVFTALSLLTVQIYAALLFWMYQVGWARTAVLIMACLSLAVRAAWPLLPRVARFMSSKVRSVPAQVVWVAREGGIAALVFLLIFVPDVEKVLANIFLQDNCYHFDSFYMSPGWGYLMHNTLNVDQISQYSVLSPILMAKLAVWMGGFTYHHVVSALIAGAIFYFLMTYIFLRWWLKDVLLALFGILLAIKLNLFHFNVSPIVWRFPSTTVIRYFFDMVFFLLLLAHVRSGRRVFLAAASATVGMALAYMMETGVYLLGGYWVYLFLATWRGQKHPPAGKLSWALAAGFAALPAAVAGAILWAIYGAELFSPLLWQHNTEYIKFFLNGFGSLPVYEYLPNKEVWAFAMGMLIPVVYGGTVLVVGSLYMRGKIGREHVVPVVLSVYGLGLYHYFVNRSAMTSYYAVVIPFACIVCYWLARLGNRMAPGRRRVMLWVLILGTVFVLFLNESFINYPNLFNVSGKDWKTEKEAYLQGSDFAADAALIKRWSGPQDKVPVVSSFATRILMEAERRPFFYYFPLLASRQMNANTFAGGWYIHTKDTLKKALDELADSRPGMVFIERRLYAMELPMPYYQAYEVLGLTVLYLRQHYEPVDAGKYLVALRRKAE